MREEADERIQSLVQELEMAHGQLEELNEQLEEDEDELDAMEEELKKTRKRVDELGMKNAEMAAQVHCAAPSLCSLPIALSPFPPLPPSLSWRMSKQGGGGESMAWERLRR